MIKVFNAKCQTITEWDDQHKVLTLNIVREAIKNLYTKYEKDYTPKALEEVKFEL